MKKKVFSGGIYIEGLRQLRVFGFIALSLCLVVFIAGPLLQYADYVQCNPNTVREIYPTAVDFESLLGPLMGLPVFVAPIMTLIVFSGFNKRKYSDFYHALPYTRLCIFLSFTAAILSWIFGILIIAGSVSLLMHLLFPTVYALSFVGWADVLLSLIVMILMVVSGILLGCSFTGTLFSNITATGLVLFLPRLIISLITSTIAKKLPFVVKDHFLTILSPRFNVLIDYLYKTVFTYGNSSLQDNLWCDLYSLIIALAMGVLAAILFIRRKSEIASKSSSHRSIQAGIRIALTLVFSFVATCILLNDEESSIAISLYIIAVLVFFIYELLTTLKWKNLIRIIPTLGIVVLLNLGLAGMVNGITTAATAFRPDAQDITSIRFVDAEDSQIWSSYWFENSCYAEKAAQKISIDDPEIIAAVANSLDENMNKFDHGIYQRTYHSNSYTINQQQNTPAHVEKIVAIRTGAVTRYRRVIFKYETMEKIIQRLADLPKYREAYMTLPPALNGTENILLYDGSVFADVTDNNWDMDKIFACLQEEINEAGFEAWYKALNFSPEPNNWVGVSISYTVQNKYLTEVSIPIIRSLTPKTFDLLMQMHYESNMETAEDLIELLKGTFDRDGRYRNLQIDYHYIDKEGKQIDNTVFISSVTMASEEISRERVLKLMQELGNQLEKTDSLPTSDSYVGIYYYHDPGYDSFYSNYYYLYLPLPEDFNADGWNKLAADYNAYIKSSSYEYYDSSVFPIQ